MVDALRVLVASSECAPWAKTGGLADVTAALPAALREVGIDARVLMPAYRGVREAAGSAEVVARLPATGPFAEASIRHAALHSGVPVMLLDCPTLYDRDGGPYQDAEGRDHPDNARRFARLAQAAAVLATDDTPLAWRPHVLHCNDWQTALAPAYLRHQPAVAASTLMTIHNLAFQGVFPGNLCAALGLPDSAFAVDGVEYFGNTSFLKAGIFYADAISTVSPTYADEIQRAPLGFGLEGLLAHRRATVDGILNGIDTDEWNPETDARLVARYDSRSLSRKAANKRALQQRTGLRVDPSIPLLGTVSRLTWQKGSDLIADIAPSLGTLPAQLVVQGRGEPALEQRLTEIARQAPASLSIVVAFDEALAHLIEGGADLFLMPSRFEPCGLNQMYSQRYGTLPIAHRTGGLADSIVDASPAALADGSASGFLFDEPTVDGLRTALDRALDCYRQPGRWRALQRAAMQRDFGWASSAHRYASLYRRLCGDGTGEN